MAKSRDAFRTISEVADWLDVKAHVLRFWESKFSQIKPVKRAGGRRYYRPEDMLLIGGIKRLLHEDGMTIKGAQKILSSKGVDHVRGLSQPIDEDAVDAISDNAFADISDDGQTELFPIEPMRSKPAPTANAAFPIRPNFRNRTPAKPSFDWDGFRPVARFLDMSIEERQSFVDQNSDALYALQKQIGG